MSIFVSVLNEGNIRTELTRELVMFGKNTKQNIVLEYSSERPIDHNRNSIVKRFLESDCEYLLQIDCDTVPPRNFFENVPLDYDVFTLPTPIYIFDNEKYVVFYNVFKMDDKNNYRPISKDSSSGIINVDACGGGCLLIRRNVLEKIKAPFTRIFDENGLAILGSDLNFSRKCIENGFSIFADLDNPCKHFKTVDVGLFVNHGKQNT